MNLLKAKPLAILPPPNWFRQVTMGVSRLLQPELTPLHATKDHSEEYRARLRESQSRLPPGDREGMLRTISTFQGWSHPKVEQTCAFWKRTSLSIVEVIVTPTFLRTTASLGSLDRNLKNSESIVLWASMTSGIVMRLGRTSDGLHNRGGALGVVRSCDMLGKQAASGFSVTLALDLPLKDTFKLAALALCADGCRHIYQTYLAADAFDCTATPDAKQIERLSSSQSISSAIWNLHLAELCMNLANDEVPVSKLTKSERDAINSSMDDILGEDIATATCYLLAQVQALRANSSFGGFRLMDDFYDMQMLLTWRKCLALGEELSRLEWIANSSMPKRHKVAALEIPNLKTSVWQRISMRSAGDRLTDAMYPLKL